MSPSYVHTHLDDLESLELIANLRGCVEKLITNMASLKAVLEPK